METEILTDYNKSGDQLDLSNDLKNSVEHASVGNHVEKSNGNKADLDDSRSDEEEYIPLLLEGSKSDEDDDLDELDSIQNNDGSQKKADNTTNESLTDSKENEKEPEKHDPEVCADESLSIAGGCQEKIDNGVIATSERNVSEAENTEETNIENNSDKQSEENINKLHQEENLGEGGSEDDAATDSKSNEASAEERANDDTTADTKTNEATSIEEKISSESSEDAGGEELEGGSTKDISESTEKEYPEVEANEALENAKTSIDTQNIYENEKADSSNVEEEDEKSFSKPIEKKPSEAEEYNMDMYDDFDPSLLCPDIAMEVDEAPVITNNSALPPVDEDKTPSLYEPIFSTIVDEFTGTDASIILTPEEERIRQETFGAGNPVELTKIHCTACNVHLGSALNGQGNRFVHPLLKVLICKNCYHFYTSGEFERDEDGSELYCRWCGQGGQVMCCSNCEMVFCKKCIRINFDRKTITQIRDSEDWICFRCNPSQITHLKIHCAEFMEYVRRETSRASTLENAADFMKVDHCRCCLPQKKKASESACDVPKKKRRKASIDPDFDPYSDRDSPQPTTSGAQVNNNISVLSKPTDQTKNAGQPTVLNNNALLPIFKLRPTLQYVGSATAPRAAPTTSSSGPGYVKVLPVGKRIPTVNESTPRLKANIRQLESANKQSKHEWFEKTVIAAARVNSNLSYTLTQLNRQQANAVSVEALAVIHNKLQEILSTSINNLIKIRKKLRMDFIEGIKNIRFPAPNKSTPTRPPPPSSSTDQDDDVIIVSPSTSPVPPLTRVAPKPSSKPLGKQLKVMANPVLTSPPPLTPLLQKGGVVMSGKTKDTVRTVGNVQPKGFLRVRSMTALLNVPSECITIPDEPVQQEATTTTVKPVEEEKVEAKPTVAQDPSSSIKSTTVEKTSGVDKDEDDDDDDVKIIEKPIVEVDLTESDYSDQKTFDLSVDPSKKLKKMMNVQVLVERSPKVEELIQLYCREIEKNATE